MHPEPMISDAQYTRSRILEFHTHRRLIEQATSGPADHHGPRYRLGGALIAVGNRLQGIAPTLPDRQPLSAPTSAIRPVH